MKKKVLFTATVDSHILQFHLPYLKYFKENGYEVHVATNGKEEIPYCDVKHYISFERKPFKLNNIKAIKKIKEIINKEKYSIIHTHTPMGSVVTRIAAKETRKENNTRVIYTAHGFHFYKGAPILNWLFYYPIEKYLLKYTDTLITINEEDYNFAKNKFSKRCKDIKYVPGVGIDENKFNFIMTDEEKINLRKQLGLNDNDFIILYPAELSKRKRQMWLIKTLEKLLKNNSNMHLLLPGEDILKGKCQKFVKKLDLDKQVHFLGYRKDIPKLLRITDLAVSSAKQEGLPVNIMEAMQTKLAIVASNCRGNRQLVKDSINGYIVPLNNSKEFSEKIETLYKNEELRNEFGKNNGKYISKYSLDNILKQMEKIYNLNNNKL